MRIDLNDKELRQLATQGKVPYRLVKKEMLADSECGYKKPEYLKRINPLLYSKYEYKALVNIVKELAKNELLCRKGVRVSTS